MYQSEREILADAYRVQDACNLSGVVRSFAEVCSFLMGHSRDSGTIRKHPAVILFVDKIRDLVRYSDDELFKAMGEAREETQKEARV